MARILLVSSSVSGEHSTSRRIAMRLVEAARESGLDVCERDLRSLPPIDLGLLRALRKPEIEREPNEVARVGFADHLIEEIEEAELVVITAPVYSFNIPAVLKSWIEYLNRAGRVFHHGPEGNVGLLTGKCVCVVVTRGSTSSGEDQPGFAERYLKHVLGTFGMMDVTIISVDHIAHEEGSDEIVNAEARATALGEAFAARLELPPSHARFE